MDENRSLNKWLHGLLVVHIISLTYSMLTNTVNFGGFNAWLNLLINASLLLCLCKLGKNHSVYRVPAVLLSIRLICTVLRLIWSSNAVHPLIRDLFDENYLEVLTTVSTWTVWILLICDFGVLLLEPNAHSKMIKSVDLRLSKYWRWITIGALVVSVEMLYLNVIVPDMLRQGTLDIDLYQQIQPLLNLPSILVRIASIVCLFMTARLFGGSQHGEEK